jgi:hypothetical protein
MLHLSGPKRGFNCDGSTRRDFLRVGALGLGGLTLPDLLRARAEAASTNRPSKDTSVVLLWLPGGPTHMDTYDLKPEAPAEFRGAFKPIPSAVPGIEICELMPKQAAVMEHMAIVRSFSHGNAGHGGGTHWVMTGFDFPPADSGEPQVYPSPGAVVAKVRGNHPRTGMPPYIAMNRIYGDGPAFLGVDSAPFESGGQAKQNMSLAGGIDITRLGDRRALLKGFDRIRRDIDARGMMNGLDSFEQQAFSLILGKAAREAFDVTLEDPKVRSRYGSGLGEQMLVARRLCEAGASFVNIAWNGWDDHGSIEAAMRAKLPPLDQAVATFVEDCQQRGLDKRVLMVITGEFGRTPRVNGSAGRDHWPTGMFATLAGGGLRMGQVVGETTAKGEVPRTRAVSPQDLMATIYHVLGIDRDTHFYNGAGRPTPIITDGKPVAELV